MLIRRFSFCFVTLVALNQNLVTAMTRQQIKKSFGLMKKNCMPKNDATEEQVGDIDKGKFIESRNVMCYIACVYAMGGAIKNNKFQYDMMIKQVDMMFPTDMKEDVKSAINQCRGVEKKYKDICDASFWTAKCIYEADPKNFVFAYEYFLCNVGKCGTEQKVLQDRDVAFHGSLYLSLQDRDVAFHGSLYLSTHLMMSRQQLKNSSKMLKKNCMAKNQVTEDQIGSIEKGKFVEEKSVMCYIACIYQMSQIVKNNKLNYEASMKQIDMMWPPELKASAKKSVENCKDISSKYKDLCEASYWTAKCMYEDNPKDFIFA